MLTAGRRHLAAETESIIEARRGLGAELAAYRHAAGRSQAELARLTGYSGSTVATMAELLTGFGIPTRAALTAALRQLVLQAPAPVIAQALGYHHNTAHKHASQAAGPWARYAPGDHAQ